MAQIHFKRQDYIPFEERLTKAVLCPFTMSGAASLYKQYWELVAMGSQSSLTTPTMSFGEKQNTMKSSGVPLNQRKQCRPTSVLTPLVRK
jgi:hypothetical protein